AVARAEDEVDHPFSGAGLGEPVGERDVGLAAQTRELGEDRVDVAGTQEDVEVLGVARDPRVALEREGAADQKGDVRLDESYEGLTVQRALGHAPRGRRVHGRWGCSIRAVERTLSSWPGSRTLAEPWDCRDTPGPGARM